MADKRKLIKTNTPGVYRRDGKDGGKSYVVIFYAGGRQRKEYAHSLPEAKKLRAARQADVSRGEFHESSRATFKQYATEWVERYQGSGRGFRDSTRTDYRRHLQRHLIPFFGERKRLAEIRPRDVANLIGWLCNEVEQGVHAHALELLAKEPDGGRDLTSLVNVARRANPPTRELTDKTVRNIVGTLRTCLATAVREDLVRSNAARDVALPHRPKAEEEDGEDVRALTRKQLGMFLKLVHPRHRLMFRLLAATGLRWSELIALQRRHINLDGARPCVKVRRGIVRGRIEPPKSRHGRRDVPLDRVLVHHLREHCAGMDVDDLVFPSEAGTPLHHSNVLGRILRPVAGEIGAPWAGFHTFRHTCASILFERGANAVQVQRWLGHHSAAFTLATYVHLLGDDVGEPLSLERELPEWGNDGATKAPEKARNDDDAIVTLTAA
jgi:integrase